MLTVFIVLALAAAVTVVLSAMSKCPIWVPVGILCVIEILRALPLGR